MKNPDDLLNKHAKIHMKQWDLKQFKLKYPSLYKTIVGAINDEKHIKELFIGKVVDEIGFDKTFELLTESKKAFIP